MFIARGFFAPSSQITSADTWFPFIDIGGRVRCCGPLVPVPRCRIPAVHHLPLGELNPAVLFALQKRTGSTNTRLRCTAPFLLRDPFLTKGELFPEAQVLSSLPVEGSQPSVGQQPCQHLLPVLCPASRQLPSPGLLGHHGRCMPGAYRVQETLGFLCMCSSA